MSIKILLCHKFKCNIRNMETKKTFAFRMRESVVTPLKHLHIDLKRPLGDLLEEAIQDILKKYESKLKPPSKRP